MGWIAAFIAVLATLAGGSGAMLDTCPPDGVAREACLLKEGATYSSGVTDVTDPEFQTHYAIAVARTVPILAATDPYGYAASDPGFTKPGTDAELILQARRGICGNHTALALALFDELGIKARSVQFYFEADNTAGYTGVSGARRSHSTVEAYINGAWRYLDTTYGAVWIRGGQLATLAEVLDNPRVDVRWNNALLPFQPIETHPLFDPLEAGGDIIRGGIGTIHIRPVESFSHIPNYVGKGINMVVDQPGSYDVTVEVAGMSPGPTARLCIDRSCVEVTTGANTLVVEDPYQIQLLDPGYVVIKSVTFTPRDDPQ